jgi:hypothetical protein
MTTKRVELAMASLRKTNNNFIDRKFKEIPKELQYNKLSKIRNI